MEAKKKIQALKNRLDSGEDFGTLAMNFSEQPETRSEWRRHGFRWRVADACRPGDLCCGDEAEGRAR